MDNVGDIYNYCNDDLLDGELSGIADILKHLNKAQNIIIAKSPLQAKTSFTMSTTHAFTLPTNWLQTKKMTWLLPNETTPRPIQPDEVWANEVTMPTYCTEGTVYLYYHKKATPLTGTLTQVPDVDYRYYPAMAEYAAKMYKLKDDDTEMAKEFEKEFLASLNEIANTQDGSVVTVRNIW